MKLIRLDEVDSTNEYAKRIIQKDPDNLTLPLCIVANYQTNGKGRHGHSWLASKGKNLLCSHVSVIKFDVVTYSKLVAVVAASTIKHLYPALRVNIKWPNDILVNSKKVAGILVEKFKSYYIAGVGINLNQNNFKGLPFATSIIRETGYISNILDVINEFYKTFSLFNNVDKTLIHRLYDEILWKYGEEVILTDKKSRIKGKIIEVNYYGELVLQTKEGIKKFSNDDFSIFII